MLHLGCCNSLRSVSDNSVMIISYFFYWLFLVFDRFVGLALKGLKFLQFSYMEYRFINDKNTSLQNYWNSINHVKYVKTHTCESFSRKNKFSRELILLMWLRLNLVIVKLSIKIKYFRYLRNLLLCFLAWAKICTS